MKSKLLYVLLAPTAGGKKAVLSYLAPRLEAEIVSFDSMKIYRGMDLGTAKPSPDEIKKYHYHLINIIRPSESYDVARFVTDAGQVIKNIQRRRKKVLCSVGTPLYFRCLLYGIFAGPARDESVRQKLERERTEILYRRLKDLDPKGAQALHPNDRKRIIRALEVHQLTGKPISEYHTHYERGQPKTPPRYPVRLVGLRWKKEDLYKRIDQRLDEMFKQGLVEEVRVLWGKKLLGEQALKGIGYSEVVRFIKNEITLPEARELTRRRTRALAKKQMTWFRSFPDVHWVDVSHEATRPEVGERILEFFT